MPREGTKILDSGDEFPKLEIQRVGGGTLSLPMSSPTVLESFSCIGDTGDRTAASN